MDEAVKSFLAIGSDSYSTFEGLLTAIAVGFVVALFGFVGWASSDRGGFAVIGVVGTGTALVALFLIITGVQDIAEDKVAAYPSVTTALEEDYGIALDELETEKLLNSKPVAAKVDDEQILITLQEDTEGFWRLYSNGAALPLVNDEAPTSESE